MDLTVYRYRVFLSYCEKDRSEAAQVVSRLRRLRLEPVWDQDNRGGWPFIDLTKRRIAYSHLVVPLLTRRSMRSTWVNHEIGFAVGCNVPLLPLSLGPMPRGMAEALHAETAGDLDDLLSRLTRKRVHDLVQGNEASGMYESVDFAETRTEAIIRRCKEARSLGFGKPQPLRHRGAFGSFSLPATPDDPIWRARYDGEPGRATMARKAALSEERRLLESHALQHGCDLVLYPSLPHLTPVAVAARLEILRSALLNLRKASGPVRVRFDETALTGNILIVGDWFCAESITPHPEGYRHTTITCHAPTVTERIVEFERMFDSGPRWMSVNEAIAWLDERLRQ